MTEIDPLQLTAADWDQVGATLGFLWVFWLSVVGAALLLLTAHAIIPSLTTTGHLGPQFSRIRPVIYVIAIVVALVAAYAFVSFVNESSVLRTIYGKVWI